VGSHRGGERLEIVGGVEVEGQRLELLEDALVPESPGALQVALAAALAERRPDRVGGTEEEPIGPGPVAVGNDADPADAHPPQRGVELGRVEQGTVAGQEADRLGAERLRPEDAQRRGL
jgi:hypothetical protein